MNQIVRTAMLVSLAFSLAATAIAQQENRDTKFPGYYNPKTRTFSTKVAPSLVSDVATKTYTGTFKFNITVKLDTAVPSGSELLRSASAETVDAGTTNVILESEKAKATVSGTTGTCNISIPYSWALASESSDTVSLSYELLIVPTSTTQESFYLATMRAACPRSLSRSQGRQPLRPSRQLSSILRTARACLPGACSTCLRRRRS